MDTILSIAAERRVGSRTVLTLSTRGQLAGQIEIATKDLPVFRIALQEIGQADHQIQRVIKLLEQGQDYEIINRLTRCPAERIEQIDTVRRAMDALRAEETILYFDEEVSA
jgi:hypothetical protein